MTHCCDILAFNVQLFVSGLFILDLTFFSPHRVAVSAASAVGRYSLDRVIEENLNETCYEKWEKILYTKDRNFGASLLLMAEEIRESGTDSFQ